MMVTGLLQKAQAQLFEPDREEVIEEARASFEIGDYLTVRKLLEPMVSEFDTDPELMYFYGGASFFLEEFHKEAFPFLKVAYRLGEMRALDFYVKSLLEQYRIAEAEQVLEEAGVGSTENGRLLMAQVATAKRMMATPRAAVIENMGEAINTGYTEHSPLVTHNDSVLFFTSRRPRFEDSETDLLGRYDENVFRSERSPEGWTPATALKGEVNDILNDAAVSLQADGERMVVFKTARDLESSDLWTYHREENGKWKRDEKLSPSINSEWIENGLTSSTNGDVYIVSSDRPGGYGGMDLYRVVRFGNGDFSEPVNLGSSINTAYDEIAPVLLLDDRTLFFSHNGPNSMGGFDVFKTTFTGDSVFTSIENLGYPINSTRNDLHLTVSPSSSRAYFTRSKDEDPADFDIYTTNLPGFNLKATVYRFQLMGDLSEIQGAEFSLFTQDFSEILGLYALDDRGRFVVVLLPGEEGIIGIDLPDGGSYELEVHYHPSDEIKTIDVDLSINDILK